MSAVPEAGRVNHQVEAFLEHWDVGEIHAAVELPGGMFLKPLRLVTDRGSFVLREHAFRNTREAFAFQFDLVNGCSDAGVPCARIIPTRDEAIGIQQDETFVALHEYVRGTVYNWIDWRGRKHRGDGFLHNLGSQVARMHNAAGRLHPDGSPTPSPTFPPMRFDLLPEQREDCETRLSTLTGMDKSVAPLSREAFLANLPRLRRQWDRLVAWNDSVMATRLPRQPVHGDVSAVNLVFADAEDTASFIDWDACHNGWRLYDALGDVLNRPPHEQAEWNEFDAWEVTEYLAGYRETADPPVTADEHRAVPLFCLARQMEDLRQRLFTIITLDREFDQVNAILIRRRLEMMEQIEPLTPCV